MDCKCHICTCARLTTGVTLFADITQLIKALWAVFHTQFGARQLQQGGETGPAGLLTWARAQLAGGVAPLAAGAVSVIPNETNLFFRSRNLPVNHNRLIFYPEGQRVTQTSWRRKCPEEHVMQSLGEAPLQVEQAWSHGEQYPSSVPSAICLVSYVPAGHFSTHVLS